MSSVTGQKDSLETGCARILSEHLCGKGHGGIAVSALYGKLEFQYAAINKKMPYSKRNVIAKTSPNYGLTFYRYSAFWDGSSPMNRNAPWIYLYKLKKKKLCTHTSTHTRAYLPVYA